MELLDLAPLKTVHWMLAIFVVSLVLFIVAAWPEIWNLISPTQRIIKRGEAKSRREKDARVKRAIADMRKNPWLGDIEVIDYEKGLVEAVGRPPRTWRYHLLSAAMWTANRPWWVEWDITERIFNSLLPMLKERR